MDSLKKMNEALKYIEENLDNDIDFNKVARFALCSECYFQRVFSFFNRYYPIRIYLFVGALLLQHLRFRIVISR
ncbi:hypothetical protein ACR77J_13720 [Tissierella praeacuta]|uniref:hypothetical protein n=1 Tax=Tissierella praeacuta TaxID=43131 RepID=UPI003DA52D61